MSEELIILITHPDMGMEPAILEIFVTTLVVSRATFSLLLSITA